MNSEAKIVYNGKSNSEICRRSQLRREPASYPPGSNGMGGVVVMGFLLAALLVMPAGESSQADVAVQTLENGLRVAVEENHSARVVALRIYVGVGGVFEGPYLGCGVSHYCEHLVSGGTTATRTERESQRMVAAIGAQCNAYTSSDRTCYHMECPSEHWQTGLDFLSDWVMNCAMDSAEVAREKGVILEEFAKGEDEPARVISKLLGSNMFRHYELGIPTIGYRENFERLEPSDVSEFYRYHYVPNNTLVVVVGDIDADLVMQYVRDRMGGWERRPHSLPILHEEPRQIMPRETVREMDVGVATIRLGFPTVSISDPDLYPLDLLACVLGRGESSRLATRLRDQTRLVYSVSCHSYTPWFGPGTFTIHARLEPDSIPRMLAVLWNELEAVKLNPPDPDELAKAVNQIRAAEVFARQTCSGEASALGSDLLATGDPTFSWRYVDRLAEVLPEEIAETARRHLVVDRQTTALLLPKGTAPVRGEGTSLCGRVSDVKSLQLPNGLRVLIRRTGFAPVVACRAYFRGGSHREVEGTNGRFRFMSRMLMEGTQKRSAQELRSLLDRLGTTTTCNSGRFTVGLEMTALSEHLEESLRLAAEVLTQPSFPADRMEKVRQELLAELRSERDDWHREAQNLLTRTFYRDHPYGLNPAGCEEVLGDLQAEDLREVHARYVHGGNGVLAVYGDVDVDRVQALIEELFGMLPAGAPPDEPVPPPEPIREDTTAWEANDKGQTVVCLGFSGVSMGDPDRYALDVLDALVSGVNLPGGWLHDALRGREDLVYYIHLVPWWQPQSGAIVVVAQTSPENRSKVVDIILQEIDRMKHAAIDTTELEAAKATCIAAHDIYHQDSASQAEEAALNELHGLGHGFMDDYASRINQVGAEGVRRVANTYLGPHVLAMTGPVEAFTDLQ